MKDLIKKKVLSKQWSFIEVSDLANSIGALANDIYIELSLQERFELIRDIRINEECCFDIVDAGEWCSKGETNHEFG